MNEKKKKKKTLHRTITDTVTRVRCVTKRNIPIEKNKTYTAHHETWNNENNDIVICSQAEKIKCFCLFKIKDPGVYLVRQWFCMAGTNNNSRETQTLI